MAGRTSRLRTLDAVLATLLALAALPYLIMALWVFEQNVVGTNAVSAFCHAIEIDEPLDSLYRWLTGR
jgi:hypothetical protein